MTRRALSTSTVTSAHETCSRTCCNPVSPTEAGGHSRRLNLSDKSASFAGRSSSRVGGSFSSDKVCVHADELKVSRSTYARAVQNESLAAQLFGDDE